MWSEVERVRIKVAAALSIGSVMGIVLGVGLALASLPIIYLAGLSTLYLVPTLGVYIGFEVFRRAFNYSLSRTGREILFTIVSVDAKYKSKNFIDTFVYRAGDTIAAGSVWVGEGLAATSFALIALPISVCWVGLAFHLGKKQEQYRDPRDPPPGLTPAGSASARWQRSRCWRTASPG